MSRPTTASNFAEFFFKSTGKSEPYSYQCRLACGELAKVGQSDSLKGGTDCQSKLISVPTGLGKTAAVVLAWMWNRVCLGREQPSNWPRRLVYCLPMRTLVEQTEREVHEWLKANGWLWNNDDPRESHEGKVGVHILMGGEDAGDWDLYPEENAILIGTQDMLLSRALNRGYGMSRYRWPMHFGLLNNDCLWVLDETQLMGVGVGTATQLEAFRDGARFGSFPSNDSVTWYVSATTNAHQLITREWRDKVRPKSFAFGLSDEEKAAETGSLAQRRLARKTIESHRNWHFGDKQVNLHADEIIKRHQSMVLALANRHLAESSPRRTLIICNTVSRAVAMHEALHKKLGVESHTDLRLMHSRFRQREKGSQRAALSGPLPSGGQIIVATQVIEAGVDLSSAILWSEIAPLASIVQRLGRLNRAGEFGFGCSQDKDFACRAIIVGVEEPESEDAAKGRRREPTKPSEDLLRAQLKAYLPYDMDACVAAWPTLKELSANASPAAFEEPSVARTVAASIAKVPYSLQQHELLDLFDTDANLSLGFTDVSPFVRGTDPETDFEVLWRDWDGSRPDFLPDFQRQELCAVSIGKAQVSMGILRQGWHWRGKDAGWISIQDSGVYPGMTILLPCHAGGYSTVTGWSESNTDGPVTEVYAPRPAVSDEEMLSSLDNGWRSIAAHTAEVKQFFTAIRRHLPHDIFTTDEVTSIERGMCWHDVGKNHPLWQQAAETALKEARLSVPAEHLPLAKFSLSDSPEVKNDDGTLKLSGHALQRAINKLRRKFKPGLAHEVASALAFRQHEQDRLGKGVTRPLESLLAEYLIMAHHGHVRKVVRDELPKNSLNSKDANSVRGICDNDDLPAVQIHGKSLGGMKLSTDCRRIGRDSNGHESYTRGVLRLLDHYGPFRLAFLEAIFRAADIRASIAASKEHEA